MCNKIAALCYNKDLLTFQSSGLVRTPLDFCDFVTVMLEDDDIKWLGFGPELSEIFTGSLNKPSSLALNSHPWCYSLTFSRPFCSSFLDPSPRSFVPHSPHVHSLSLPQLPCLLPFSSSCLFSAWLTFMSPLTHAKDKCYRAALIGVGSDRVLYPDPVRAVNPTRWLSILELKST